MKMVDVISFAPHEEGVGAFEVGEYSSLQHERTLLPFAAVANGRFQPSCSRW
jgi:hypothetical protein